MSSLDTQGVPHQGRKFEKSTEMNDILKSLHDKLIKSADLIMNKKHLLRSIVKLPDDFNSRGDISSYLLLKEMGYFQKHNQVMEIDIKNELVKHPESIEQWIRWSEDKRTSSGWYFQQAGSNSFSVSPCTASQDSPALHFSDKHAACAAFIKREIEDIRNISVG